MKAQGQSWEEAGIQIRPFEEQWANNDDCDIQTRMGLIVKDMTGKRKREKDTAGKIRAGLKNGRQQLLPQQTLHDFDLCLKITWNYKAKEMAGLKLQRESLTE